MRRGLTFSAGAEVVSTSTSTSVSTSDSPSPSPSMSPSISDRSASSMSSPPSLALGLRPRLAGVLAAAGGVGGAFAGAFFGAADRERGGWGKRVGLGGGRFIKKKKRRPHSLSMPTTRSQQDSVGKTPSRTTSDSTRAFHNEHTLGIQTSVTHDTPPHYGCPRHTT